MRNQTHIGTGVLLTALIWSAAASTAPAAAPTVAVTIVDASAGAAGEATPVTVCVDDVTTSRLITAQRGGPYALTAGAHHIGLRHDGSTCSSPPEVTASVRIPAVAAATLVIGLDASGTTMRVYDSSACVPAGSTRLVVRDAGEPASAPALWVASAGGSAQRVVDLGTDRSEGSSVVPAGPRRDVAVRSGTTTLTDFGPTRLESGGVVEFYVYGGTSGPAAAFSFSVSGASCPSSATAPGPSSTDAPDPAPGPLPVAAPATPLRASQAPTYIG